MRKIIPFFIALLILLLLPKSAFAIYDPASLPNNLFGIHIADPVDLSDAAKLVNSGGGDWGYVTFVIQKTERDTRRWQVVFDEARRLHLIPIVRIATRGQGINWEKPSLDEIDGWVSFLNELNWVVKNRYVVVGNEPNHAEEWGGEVNPGEYATYLKIFSEKLKKESDDFFVLPAGLDASAPNSKSSLDESNFLRMMISAEPDFFELIDGWTSHSYPNPAFSGSENDSGKGTVRTFVWEMDFLKSLGLTKNLPIFITETGWAHKVDRIVTKYLESTDIGQKMTNAFSNAWSDRRIAAVTPFILSYQDTPFDIFSWKDKNGDFYPFYTDVQKIVKRQGKPIQITKGEISALFIPPLQIAGSSFTGIVLVKNLGQSIWNNREILIELSQDHSKEIEGSYFSDVEPGKSRVIFFKGNSPKVSGVWVGKVTLIKDSLAITNSIEHQIIVVTPLDMQIRAAFDKIVGWFK